MALDDRSGLGEGLGVAEQSRDRSFFSRLKNQRDLNGAARIERGADAIRQRLALEGGRTRQRAVASDELGSIAGHGATVPWRQIEERHALGEVLAEAIARQERAGDVVA